MPRSKDRAASPRTSRTSRSVGGEFELLAAIRKTVASHGLGRGVVVGIGDDAAIVEGALPRLARARGGSLVLTTDTMVEHVHFRRPWLTAPQIGARAYRAAVSDVSAMGARPLWVLLSLELPAGRRRIAGDDIVGLIRAASREARRTGATVVGGNVSRGPVLAVTTTVVGESAARPALRSGAKPGHLVFATGTFGGAAAARSLLMNGGSGTRGASAWRVPPLRVEFAAAAAGFVSAMIDVSDGLLQDAGHIAAESGVTLELDRDCIPIARAARSRSQDATRSAASPSAIDLALTGGEDYELVFTAPRAREADIAKLARKHRVAVTRIGIVRRGKPIVTDVLGKPLVSGAAGFDHLRAGATPRMKRKPAAAPAGSKRATPARAKRRKR